MDGAELLDITAISLPAGSAEVATLRQQLGGDDGERKSFKDCYYDKYKHVGVSLSFDITEEVPVDGHDACTMRLPHELHTTQTAKSVVELLGEPSAKSGGRIQELSISYEGLGVQIDFCGTDWDDADNIIKCITFFEPC